MRIAFIIAGILGAGNAIANDWDGVPVPAPAGAGLAWTLQPQSDDFNYAHPAKEGKSPFYSKWTDSYHNSWTGPGLTVWDRDHVIVSNGCLRIPASRFIEDGERKVNTGCITSTTRVQYPLYIEARAKISNSVLASDVWLLSPDDTQEIDILEAYGASWSEGAAEDQTWFATRLHLSHHVFTRQPLRDYQPLDEGSWIEADQPWREAFHRVGVHWKDPWNLDYYVDGKRVRSVSGEALVDPHGYTRGTGLSKAMDIIINVEDQDWRSRQGLTPTDDELKDVEGHTYQVDWVRVYKPTPVLNEQTAAN